MKNDLPRPEYSSELPSESPRPRAAPVRRHRVSAIEGDADDVDVPDSGGNLSRIFTFLLLLHVFLIGAVVLYNIFADKPTDTNPAVDQQMAATEAASASAETTVTPRSEQTAEQQVAGANVDTVEYIVTPGKNLQAIAEETGATSEQIIALNNLNENGALYVGRKLKVPAKGGATAPQAPAAAPVAEAPKAEPPVVAEAPKVQMPAPAVAAEKKAEKPAAEAPGKSLDKPAEKRPETTVAAKAVEKKAEPAPAKLDAPAKPAAAKTTAAASGRTHQVQNGETFYGIARKHDVSVKELMKLNGFTDAGKLRKGTVLKLPAN